MPGEPVELGGGRIDESLPAADPVLAPRGECVIAFVAGGSVDKAAEIEPATKRSERSAIGVLVVHELIDDDIAHAA